MQKFEKHSPVVVTEVTTKHELRQFMQYPNRLYADNPNYIPSFYGDDLSDWTPGKNPAFDYCEARCWLARRDGEIVGRIGAILSHKANDKFGTHRMRFSQVDFVDDSEVSAALFGTVERWAREKGCDQVHGPLGFTDMDREGMLVEGFDRRSLFFTNYNAPYYLEHLTRLGYRKDVDWIEYRITVPEPGGAEAERLHKLSEFILKRKHLHVATVHHKSEYGPFVRQVFELVNAAYAPLYGVVELSDEQIERYANKFIPLVDPDFVCFVVDEQDQLVAFGVTALDPSVALKHSDGRLFPFGWAGVLNDLHHSDTLIMLLTAVRPDLQAEGINAVMMDHVCQSCNRHGVRVAETGPMLELNDHILAQWKRLEKEQHKRRRCFIKDLDHDVNAANAAAAQTETPETESAEEPGCARKNDPRAGFARRAGSFQAFSLLLAGKWCMISYVFAQQGSPRGQGPPRMRSRIAARRCLLPEEKVARRYAATDVVEGPRFLPALPPMHRAPPAPANKKGAAAAAPFSYLVVSQPFARSRYSPTRVSTRMRSPGLMNSGTLISAPVSRVAGLVALVAVLPAKPGSVSVTSSSTNVGGSTRNTLPL